VDKGLVKESSIVNHDLAELFNQTVFLMPNWKWLGLVVVVVLGFVLHPMIKLALRQIKKHNPIAHRFPDSFTAFLFTFPIERPLAWILTICLWMIGGNALGMPDKLGRYYENTMSFFLAINVIVLAFYAVDAMSTVFVRMGQKNNTSYNVSGQLIPYAAKALKVLILVLGVLIALQNFGLNVMSLLAGLGLGGLALALAAQDTAANVFGSVAIMFDNPFKVGDWIKLKDAEGTVEEIGFRSTRIRTFYNSVVTLPNAMIAKEVVDNMGVRPARRIRQILGITYETPIATIPKFCDALREMIKAHPEVNADTVTVNFNNFNASSLDILMNFHIRVYTGPEEMELQQQIFLEILKIAADMKVEFAYPTQTTYAKTLEEPASAKADFVPSPNL
jgi:MscS family membrane protein